MYIELVCTWLLFKTMSRHLNGSPYIYSISLRSVSTPSGVVKVLLLLCAYIPYKNLQPRGYKLITLKFGYRGNMSKKHDVNHKAQNITM